MQRLAPKLCREALLRACFFEPTFYKFKGELCEGIQIHADHAGYHHDSSQPYRLALVMLKAVRNVAPKLLVWRDPPYEYEFEKLPIDLLNGSTSVRKWIDNPSAGINELEALLTPSENKWRASTKPYLIY